MEEDRPFRCKLLVRSHVAGAIIGKQGSQIQQLELSSQCKVRISAPHVFFPGTQDRVLLLVNSRLEHVMHCLGQVFRYFKTDGRRTPPVNMVVPAAVAASLVAWGGAQLRQLSQETGCYLRVSPRVEGLQERLLFMSGELEPLLRVCAQLCAQIQRQPPEEGELQLPRDVAEARLDVRCPSGAYDTPDPGVPPLDPALCATFTKRELLGYLGSTAPREILMKYGLLGTVKNILKCRSADELAAAVAETWEYQGGSQEEEPPLRGLPPHNALSFFLDKDVREPQPEPEVSCGERGAQSAACEVAEAGDPSAARGSDQGSTVSEAADQETGLAHVWWSVVEVMARSKCKFCR